MTRLQADANRPLRRTCASRNAQATARPTAITTTVAASAMPSVFCRAPHNCGETPATRTRWIASQARYVAGTRNPTTTGKAPSANASAALAPRKVCGCMGRGRRVLA
ncbi:hypothetical protein D3C71_1255990 [compost metagenome]